MNAIVIVALAVIIGLAMLLAATVVGVRIAIASNDRTPGPVKEGRS